MFGCQPPLPIDFYFPMIRGMKKHQHVDHCIAELCEWLWAQVQSTSEVERQKWHYNRKANAISLEPGDLVLANAYSYRGRRKVKDQWEEELYEVEHQVVESIPSYLKKNQQTGGSWVLHWNWIFLITPAEGNPLCKVVWAKQARCTTTTLEEQTRGEWDWGSTTKCELSITGPASDMWYSSRMGEQETLCIHADVFQSFLARSRVRSLM